MIWRRQNFPIDPVPWFSKSLERKKLMWNKARRGIVVLQIALPKISGVLFWDAITAFGDRDCKFSATREPGLYPLFLSKGNSCQLHLLHSLSSLFLSNRHTQCRQLKYLSILATSGWGFTLPSISAWPSITKQYCSTSVIPGVWLRYIPCVALSAATYSIFWVTLLQPALATMRRWSCSCSLCFIQSISPSATYHCKFPETYAVTVASLTCGDDGQFYWRWDGWGWTLHMQSTNMH